MNVGIHFFSSKSSETCFSLPIYLARTTSMSEFNPTPFKGESSVPHVPEDWFTTLFIGMQVRGKEEDEFSPAA